MTVRCVFLGKHGIRKQAGKSALPGKRKGENERNGTSVVKRTKREQPPKTTLPKAFGHLHVVL